MREHQHDGVFGDGQRVDADAIGHHGAALRQQVEGEEIEARIDRIEPFEVGGGGDNLRHRRVLREIEPADLGQGRELQRLLPRGEPARLDPVGQARFDQRTDHGGKNGCGHAGMLLWRHPICWR